MSNITKYKPEFVDMLNRMRGKFEGTLCQIAAMCDATSMSIGNWMEKYPEFKDAVLACREAADSKVERSLYERAIGYEHEAEKIFCNKDGLVTRVTYTEKYPPDNVSAFFWLKNRARTEWRDVQHQEVSGPGGAALPIINIMLNTPTGQQTIAPAVDTTRVLSAEPLKLEDSKPERIKPTGTERAAARCRKNPGPTKPRKI